MRIISNIRGENMHISHNIRGKNMQTILLKKK